ncbi:MAG: PUR family DNA/RNA-binding protein [Paludibacteraceae bacterium]|jgi:hypothetical protein|nr:PUR family DNA/RNA-binding protein [Paludibacteraceae bacterium]MBO5863128.1 PUR family DNA/RNA-binding protein [Paludibacteraceae bacterium]MBO5988845.1 PUR family DNA/RNA-binding protein [Paludibacteraceae bacterium]MEE0996590.1 DUF3276 family protein [Paludibacteraceae bacterium]MEE1542743.1 DUF3276 family protein [Paludibacteraceae bacterium]
MEDFKRKNDGEKRDQEIVYSKAIKAGKRIYYLDVKKNRKDDLFLAITESKKKVNGEGDDAQISFEKHKIFLYKEDFEKFSDGLAEVISFINKMNSEGGVVSSETDFSSQDESDDMPGSSFDFDFNK